MSKFKVKEERNEEHESNPFYEKLVNFTKIRNTKVFKRSG